MVYVLPALIIPPVVALCIIALVSFFSYAGYCDGWMGDDWPCSQTEFIVDQIYLVTPFLWLAMAVNICSTAIVFILGRRLNKLNKAR
jgi:hypothetical protein